MMLLKEPIIMFDVDDTLVLWGKEGGISNDPNAVDFECMGTIYKLVPHEKHIEYLKKCKHDGFKVVVWSYGGMDWAYEVVTTLNLTKYVDLIMSKPEEYVDDMDCKIFMHKRTYLPVGD
jgi:predicted phosphatase